MRIIEECITDRKGKLKGMQKKLVDREQRLSEKLANSKFIMFLDTPQDGAIDKQDKYKWLSILGFLSTRVFHLIKQDMCTNRSSMMKQVKSTVISAFTVPIETVIQNFVQLEQGQKIQESVYYVAGWLLHA